MKRAEGPVIGSRLRRWLQNPYKILARLGLDRGHTFLDIGCGRGFLTLPAAHIVGWEDRVYAVDISSDHLDELRLHVKKLGLGNVEVIQTDAVELDGIPEMTVDRAALIFSLHHIERRADALSTLLRKLRPGASIIIVDPIKSRMLGHGTQPEEMLRLFKNVGYTINYYGKGLVTWTAILAPQYSGQLL